MSIPEAYTRLCYNSGTGQAFTVQAISENVIKLGKDSAATKKMIGLTDLVLEILIKTDFVGLDSGVTLELVVDTAAALTTDPEVIAATGLLSLAELNAGPHYLRIPPTELSDRIAVTGDIYLGLRFTPASEAASAGNIIAQFIKHGLSKVT